MLDWPVSWGIHLFHKIIWEHHTRLRRGIFNVFRIRLSSRTRGLCRFFMFQSSKYLQSVIQSIRKVSVVFIVPNTKYPPIIQHTSVLPSIPNRLPVFVLPASSICVRYIDGQARKCLSFSRVMMRTPFVPSLENGYVIQNPLKVTQKTCCCKLKSDKFATASRIDGSWHGGRDNDVESVNLHSTVVLATKQLHNCFGGVWYHDSGLGACWQSRKGLIACLRLILLPGDRYNDPFTLIPLPISIVMSLPSWCTPAPLSLLLRTGSPSLIVACRLPFPYCCVHAPPPSLLTQQLGLLSHTIPHTGALSSFLPYNFLPSQR
jgi:hypothetical protein